MGRFRPTLKSGPVCRRIAPSQLRNRALSAGRACFSPIEELSYSHKHRYPFQRSRPPRRRPRYPSLGALSSRQAPYRSLPRKRESSFTPLPLLFRQNHSNLPETVLAHFTSAISSLGACIQLSARIAISERDHPASSHLDFLECSASAHTQCPKDSGDDSPVLAEGQP